MQISSISTSQVYTDTKYTVKSFVPPQLLIPVGPTTVRFALSSSDMKAARFKTTNSSAFFFFVFASFASLLRFYSWGSLPKSSCRGRETFDPLWDRTADNFAMCHTAANPKILPSKTCKLTKFLIIINFAKRMLHCHCYPCQFHELWQKTVRWELLPGNWTPKLIFEQITYLKLNIFFDLVKNQHLMVSLRFL